MTMGTWFRYVCLTHTPALVSEVDIHGHGSVTNSDTVAKMRELWEFVTYQRFSYAGKDYASAEEWLRKHRRCLIGVQDGYGGQVELGQALPLTPPADDPTEDWDMEYLGEVLPGKRYLLRATENISPEQADQIKRRLREVFPDSEFGILTPSIEAVTPVATTELVDALKAAGNKLQLQFINTSDTVSKQTSYAAMIALDSLRQALTQTGDGAAPPPATPTTAPAATGGEQAAESATGAPTPEAAPSPSYQWCGAIRDGYTCMRPPNDHVWHEYWTDSERHAWTGEWP
jgi:hypothetical protein